MISLVPNKHRRRQQQFGLMLALLLALPPSVLAQTCRDPVPPTRPDQRFVVNPDGTVRDLNTGLLWKQCAEGLSGFGCQLGAPVRSKWKSALNRAQQSVFAGHVDWRLPDQTELQTLLQPRCHGVDLDAVSFPNTPPERFWTSTPAPYYAGSAWTLHFGHGAMSFGTAQDAAYVRLVRDRAACSPASMEFCRTQ
jgi:hypothetical protein